MSEAINVQRSTECVLESSTRVPQSSDLLSCVRRRRASEASERRVSLSGVSLSADWSNSRGSGLKIVSESEGTKTPTTLVPEPLVILQRARDTTRGHHYTPNVTMSQESSIAESVAAPAVEAVDAAPSMPAPVQAAAAASPATAAPVAAAPKKKVQPPSSVKKAIHCRQLLPSSQVRPGLWN